MIYEKELSDYFTARDNKLDELLNAKLISPNIYTIHKARNKFLKINLNKMNFNFASVPESDLAQDNLLAVKTYKYFLENYIIAKYNVRKLNDLNYDNKQAFDAAFSDPKLSYKTKEYLLFLFLNAITNSKDKAAFQSYFEKFKAFEKRTELSQLIKGSYLLDLGKSKNETNQTILLDENKRKTTLDNLIGKHKGKVVYIDFWASWCAPCRASFPYSHKLQKELNAKNIVFLYLSTDENFEAWKKANTKEKLSAGNSFYLLNTKASRFIQKLNLKSIPRYILFDKEGKLVNENAFGPKEEKCKTELLQLLNE